jgi:hypothetical protein
MRKAAPFLFLLVTLFSVSCQKNEPKAFLPPELPDVAEELRFDKHVLIEPTVATSCGACPLMHHEVERITDSLDQVFHMTHYTGGPMYHPFTTYILRDVDKTVYTPLAHINRAFEEGSMVYYPFTMVEGMVESELQKETRYALALNANTIDGKHFAEVRVKPKEESDAGLLMVHLFVVEKEVVELGPEYDQRNYGNDTPGHPYYGQGNWIEGFRHTNVIRAQLTAEQGDEYNVDSELSFEYEVTDVAGFADRPADFAVIAAISKPGERLQPLLNAAYASF